jgi:hypothetical protein
MPQEWQRRAKGAAHSMQNLAASGFSAPHFEQRIADLPLTIQLIEQRFGFFKIRQLEAFGEPLVDFS